MPPQPPPPAPRQRRAADGVGTRTTLVILTWNGQINPASDQPVAASAMVAPHHLLIEHEHDQQRISIGTSHLPIWTF